MKNTVIILGLVITASIISCQSRNTTENAPVGTDSSMMAKDNTQTVTTGAGTPGVAGVLPADTSSAAKTSMAKPDPSKKGKKGKVSVTMATAGTGEMTPDKEGYYANTEVLPGFPGGQKALEKYFADNIQYPAEASDNGVEGKVDINFAVDETGKVYSPKVVSSKIGYGVEEEALRVFNNMPKWTPGKIKGKNVKTRFTLPVRFQLED